MLAVLDRLTNPRAFNRTARYSRCADRVALLREFPDRTDCLFVGDSHVERGPWQALLPGVSLANHGVGRDTAEGVLRRLPDALANPAPTVLLMVGVNDLIAGRSPQETAERIGRIVEAIDRRVIVLSVLPTRRGIDAETVALNALLADQCAGRCRFLDLTPHFTDAWLSPDGLHLSADGYRGWADALRGAL